MHRATGAVVRASFLIPLVIAACGVGPNGLDLGAPVATVRLSPDTVSLREGDTVRLVAQILDASGNPVTPHHTPVWFTPDGIHLSVDTAGLVRARLAGPATVELTADSITGIARITVLPLPVGSVDVIVPAGLLEVGDTLPLLVSIRDESGKRLIGLPVVWNSSDTSVLRVDSAGRVRAIAAGSAQITATVQGVSGGAQLTALVPAASVVVTPESLALEYDDTARLSATVRDSRGAVLAGRPVSWNLTGDSTTASLSGTLVTALGGGRVVVTAATGHVSGQAVIDVTGLTFTAVSAGATHSCGLRADGVAFCWGQGDMGELGRGDATLSPRPRPVLGGHTFTRVSAGLYTTCGVTPAGDVYCWGLNDALQAGETIGDTCLDPYGFAQPCVRSPSLIPGGVGLADVVVGSQSSCGLTAAGAAYCWGAGGILGDGTTTASATPVAVQGGLVFRTLANPNSAGTCGLTDGGDIYCWGVSPTALPQGTGFDALSGGLGLYCGLRAGALACWGLIPSSPEGGRYASAPVGLLPNEQFVHLSANEDHVCGVTAGGDAVCWGSNLYGQLGDGSLNGRFSTDAAIVVGGHDLVTLTVGGGDYYYPGYSHTCGTTAAGVAYCWGANRYGQVGAPVGQRSSVPVETTGHP
jgi:uncharacterized protein YjdB